MVIGVSAISWQGGGPEDRVCRVRSGRRVLPSGLIPSGPREFPVCPAVDRCRRIRLCPIPSRPQASKPDPPLWVLREAAHVAALRGYPEEAAAYLETLLRRSPEEYQDRLELGRLYLEFYGPDLDRSRG